MEEDRRLRFNLLGRFQCALGEVEFKEFDITTWGCRILAYMAFSDSSCNHHRINDECRAEEEPEITTDSEAFRKRRDSVKKLLVENGCKWEDYITVDKRKCLFFLTPGTYETDLQRFLEYFEAAEKAMGEEHDRLMAAANACCHGDLLEDVKGKWIKAARIEIKAKANKAREAVKRSTVPRQEAEYLSPSEDVRAQASSPPQATLPPHSTPESLKAQAHVQGAYTARRPGNTLWLTLMTIALLVVGLVLLWVKHRHDTTTFTNTEATTIALPSRPVVFDAADWRPGSEPPPVGVTPEDGFTKLHFFLLRKAIAAPQNFAKLYVSISCGEKAHVVLAQLNEPEGNTEVATDGQTHRKWEWESGRSGRTMNSKVIVEVVVWLGTKPGDSTPPTIEGEYWFDLPEKEN